MVPFLRRYSGPLLLFAGGLGLIAVAPFVMSDRSDKSTAPESPKQDLKKFYGATHTMPGVRQPPAVSPAAAGLTDTDEVIGVVIGGKARAYVVKLMAGAPQNHVINDLINGTPVTVAYNNMGRVVRVFTGTGSEPLDVYFGPSGDGSMVLEVNGHQYNQRTGISIDDDNPVKLPFDAVPFELTYWKKWRDAHPDTDVIAEPPTARKLPRPSPAAPKS